MMWYRDPRDVIALERRIAGLETTGDSAQKRFLDCICNPAAMFVMARAKRA